MTTPSDDAATASVGKSAADSQATAHPRRPRRRWFQALAQRRKEAPVCVLDLAVTSEDAQSDPNVTDASDNSATDDDGHDDGTEDSTAAGTARSRLRFGLVFVLVAIAALAGLSGWLGYRAYATVQEQRQHAQFLDAGKQAAVNLTSIDYADADDDVKRILESATGPFSEDFQKRSQPFVDMVKHVQSATVGTVAEAGVESVDGDKARVLVAMSVKTTLGAAGAEQPLRLWRMRIDVQKIGHETKVSNVEFVP